MPPYSSRSSWSRPPARARGRGLRQHGGLRHAPAALAGLVLAAAMTPARPAAAVGPGEWGLGLAPSYAFVVLGDQVEPEGGGAGAYLLYGLSEVVALRLAGSWSGHEVAPTKQDPAGGLYQVVNAAAGVRYAVDITPVRPSLDLGVGVLHARYQDRSDTSLEVHFGIGADYRVLPWLAVGAAFHYHAFLSNPTQYPVYFDLGPRLTVFIR